MPRLELFPFCYRCRRTGKWHRARYVAERQEIAERHPEGWEIIGPAEVRNVDPNARAFSPHGNLATRSHLPGGERPENEPPQPEKEPPSKDAPSKDPPVKEPPEVVPPVKEPPSEDPATLADIERFLALVFLRRYVTYCARHRRYAAMNGATPLFRELDASARFGKEIR